MTHTIRFKTKPFVVDDNGKDRRAFYYKKSVSRADCSMRPPDHTYYNSDLFPHMLQREYEKLTLGRAWSFVDNLPENVSIDTSKFMAVVTITLPDSFK